MMDPFLVFVLGALAGACLTTLASDIGYRLANREARQHLAANRPSALPSWRVEPLQAFDVRTDDELCQYLDALEQLDETPSRLRAQ